MGNYQGSPIKDIPNWIEALLFESVFKELFPNFRQTKDFKAKRALTDYKNNVTIMLRLEAEVELNDGSSEKLALMLKTAHDSQILRLFMKINNVFDIEATMYNDVVPEFEQMYKDVGVDVRFGAKYYHLNTDQPYILLEDLQLKGFVNVNRLEGFDMEHTHCVLKKLAQWHAASAVRVDAKGAYPTNISVGYYKNATRIIMKSMFNSLLNSFIDCMKSFDGHELYYDRMYENKDLRLDALYAAAKVDASEFNVLNHGDCWASNVMFNHDAFGNVKETYLVEYQTPHFGSPAQDLYNFLLSSTKYELKIQHFDYFINYYHNQLFEHLKLLNYSKSIPTLKDIHIMLHRYNAWGLSTIIGGMGMVLLDPQDDANISDLLSNNDSGIKLKRQMYSNARYRKHCEMILPWLYYRGAI